MTPALKSSCLEALVEALREVSTTVLAAADCDVLDDDFAYGPGYGAYLSLTTTDEPIQVGLLVAPIGCQVLSKALLGMEPGDEDLPAADVGDAMCEIINMVAGGLKRRVSGQLSITMGLPMFVSGHPLPNQQQEVVTRSVKIVDVTASLVLLTQKHAAAPLSRSAIGLQAAGRAPAKEQSV